MRAAGCVLLLATGCRGIFGLEEPLRAAPDAPTDGPLVDAPDLSNLPPCMQRWLAGTVQLAPPTRIAELSSASTDATPSASDRAITFASDRPASASLTGTNLWFSTRASVTSAWDAPALIANVNSSADDQRFTATADLLMAFLQSNRPGQGGYDIWVSLRPGGAALFSTPTQTGLDNINDAADQNDPAITDDGLELYFSLESTSIWSSKRATVHEPFPPPVAHPSLGTTSERDPTPTSDPRLLLLASNRAGSPDIYYALRQAPEMPFDVVLPVPTINGMDSDADPWLTADGCTLYFTSNRVTNNFDLWFATVVL